MNDILFPALETQVVLEEYINDPKNVRKLKNLEALLSELIINLREEINNHGQ